MYVMYAEDFHFPKPMHDALSFSNRFESLKRLHYYFEEIPIQNP